MVIIDDVRGLMRDLVALSEHLYTAFMTPNVHPLTSYSNIGMLEYALMENERVKVLDEVGSDVVVSDSGLEPSIFAFVTPVPKDISTAAERADYAKRAKEQQQKVLTKHRALYRWQAAQTWHKGFLSKEAQYKAQNIVPLMQAHMAFYNGDLLLQVMTHQYDIQSPKCGVNYVKSVIEI